MNKIPDPAALVKRLNRADMTVEDVDIGQPVTAGDREYVEILGFDPAPPEIDSMFDIFGHCSLRWSGNLDGEPANGSINIIAFELSLGRASIPQATKPLEGILWTNDTPNGPKRLLQKMTIFEAVQESAQFITYACENGHVQMFLVDRDDFSPLATSFDETLHVLFDYAGARGVREQLVHKDWKARLDADPILSAIRAIK
jgi:hypothetical protein